jgi:glycosyltransferase involved in cell wall biosynthesis
MADAGTKASASGGDGDQGRVVFFGTYDVHQHPRVRALQEGLAAHGYEVLECNAPLGFGTDWRVRTVRHPWLAPLLVARLATAWSRLVRKARMLPPAQAVIVPYMGHFDVHLARRLWPTSPIFLDHFVFGRDTAVDRGATWRPLLAALDRIDRAALRAADVPFVDTEGHLDLLPEPHSRAVVVPVGAPDHWFLPPRKLEGSAPLRVIFYGTYAPLQGAPVIGEAIRLLAPRHEAISFTMVGHGQDLTRTRSLAAANQAVTWRDWVEHDELPGLVQGHDVCLGIFGTTPKGLRVVPNKVYQGAAAGCAIVTSDTQAQRGALLDAALYVPPGDARALADQLLRLADDRDRVWALREAAYRRADEAFRPGAIVASLRQRLEEIEPGWSRGRSPQSAQAASTAARLQ